MRTFLKGDESYIDDKMNFLVATSGQVYNKRDF